MAIRYFNARLPIAVAMVFASPVQVSGQESPFDLGTLVLTGERVPRTTFETSSSVDVISNEELESRPQLQTLGDVLERVPNVTSTGSRGIDSITIRGIDTTGELGSADTFFGGSARPRASVVIDGRPLSFSEYIISDPASFDVERIEVFRGPQTTTQGINSIAGAIFITTARPTFSPEYRGLAEVTDRGGQRLAFSASGPIIEDELAARLSVDLQRRDSIVNFNPAPSFGRDPGEFETSAVRAKLLWEPNSIPGLTSELSLAYGNAQVPLTEQVVEPFSALNAAFDNQAVHAVRSLSLNNYTSYELGNGAIIANRLIYTDIRTDRFVNGAGNGEGFIDERDLINETTFRFGEGAALSGVFGTYFQNTKTNGRLDLSNFVGVTDVQGDVTNIGVFGELTYQINDRLNVTGGLRYQYNKEERNGFTGAIPVDFEATSEALLPKLGFGYDLSDNTRVGATISRGFNPGSVSISPFTGAQDTFDEESVWSYEAYFRARDLMGGRLNLNANLFYLDYRDYQLRTIVGFTPGGNAVLDIDNVDRARSYGLEADFEFAATERLRFNGGIGLLDTKLVRYSASAEPDAEGREFAQAPSVSLTLGTEMDLGRYWTVGAQVRYTDAYFSDAANSASLEIDPITIVDINASYRRENYEVYAYVTNLFDDVSPTAIYEGFGVGRSAVTTAPREIGIGVRMEF